MHRRLPGYSTLREDLAEVHELQRLELPKNKNAGRRLADSRNAWYEKRDSVGLPYQLFVPDEQLVRTCA